MSLENDGLVTHQRQPPAPCPGRSGAPLRIGGVLCRSRHVFRDRQRIDPHAVLDVRKQMERVVLQPHRKRLQCKMARREALTVPVTTPPLHVNMPYAWGRATYFYFQMYPPELDCKHSRDSSIN